MGRYILCIMIIFISISFSATITWSGLKEINADFIVDSADILVIQPGTDVRFENETRLIIYGEVKSLGTADKPVSLSCYMGGEVHWGGVIINSESLNNEFSFTEFSYIRTPYESGNGSLTIIESTATISDCAFMNNEGDNGGGIKVTAGNVNVLNSYFYSNTSTYGGAICVINNSAYPSTVNIQKCEFENNNGDINGGAVYIFDDYLSNFMDLSITNSDFFHNTSGNGGAISYQNDGKIVAEISKCRIYSNSAVYGSAFYATFMMMMPGDIPAQRFANLLVLKNYGSMQSGVYIEMGSTQNPSNLKFTNSTIAYNTVMMSKAGQSDTSGIYILSNGNYPLIENTILWGNTGTSEPCNFWIEDMTNPPLNDIFKYCDIEGYTFGGTNISLNPIFINPPLSSVMSDFEIDDCDMHESVLSPCSNAGDPNYTDPDGSRLNIGAYGGTNEAAKPYLFLSEDFTIPDNYAGIIDLSGGKSSADSIVLGINSQLFIKADVSSELSVKSITTPSGKFDGFCSIEPLRENIFSPLLSHGISVSETLHLTNTNLYNISIKVQKNISPVSVLIDGLMFRADTLSVSPCCLEIIDPDYLNIENSVFTGYKEVGIKVSNPHKDSEYNEKASGRVANNTVSFDADVASKKSKELKRIGIEVTDAGVDIENNYIEGGDAGIVMKSSSSGRVTNNTVSFESDVASKDVILYKTGILLLDNFRDTEISNNTIINRDCINNNIAGIEINNSKATVMYNKISFQGWDAGATRAGIKITNPSDTIKVYNNTIYSALQAFFIIDFFSHKPVNIINNIFWSDQATYITTNETKNVKFFNNCFIDSTNISGSDNIFFNPEFNEPWSGDFTLAAYSPCINAGMIIDGVHSFSEGKTIYYYGSAPDIGAEEYYQDLRSPSNIITFVSGNLFTFGWDPSSGINQYLIYSSELPYGTFMLEAVTSDVSYTAEITAEKKFYYIVASTGSSKIPETEILVNKPGKNKENIKK